MPQLSFFADENIPTELIEWLEQQGNEVSGIAKERLFGIDDLDIITKAYNENKIILTQDSDFGKIIYTQKITFACIMYLRPGHFDGVFHIPTLEVILKNSDKIKENTIIVGQRKGTTIKVRVRHLDIL